MNPDVDAGCASSIRQVATGGRCSLCVPSPGHRSVAKEGVVSDGRRTARGCSETGAARPHRRGNFGVDVRAAFLIVALGKRTPMPYVWLPRRGGGLVPGRR